MAQPKKVDVADNLTVDAVAEVVVDPVVEQSAETVIPEPVVADEVVLTTEVPEGKVKVELVEVKEGFQSIFTASGSVNFEDGVAVVNIAIANELRQFGQIK